MLKNIMATLVILSLSGIATAGLATHSQLNTKGQGLSKDKPAYMQLAAAEKQEKSVKK